MKKLLLAALLFASIASHATDLPFVNQKILTAFNETFIYAEDVMWKETNKIFQVSFWQGAVNVNAFYDELGNLLKTTRYYFEKQLPPIVVSKIKKSYPGKTILYVTEVSTEDDITYYVSLEDDNKLYNIKSDIFGNLRLIHKYNRGDK